MIFIDTPLTQKHDLLVLRAPRVLRGIQPESPQRVVTKRLSDLNLGPSPSHAVVEGDNPFLAVGKVRMRPNFQRDEFIPVGIIGRRCPARTNRPGLYDA